MHRIAILRADHLGDMILTTPLVRALHAAGHAVTVYGRKAWAPVWEHNPRAEYVALEDIGAVGSALRPALARNLGTRAFTHSIVPYHAPALLQATLLGGVPRRYCQMGRLWGRFTLQHCLKSGLNHTPRHLSEVWLDFAEALGAVRGPARPEIFLRPEESEWARSELATHLPGCGRFLLLHPFTGGTGCNWPLGTYAVLARRLLEEDGLGVVITGNESQAGAWREVMPQLPSRLWLAAGQTSLRQLMALIAAVDRVFCPSTGVLHLSSALNKPSVGLFCAARIDGPEMWRSLAANAITLRAPEGACRRWRDSRQPKCGFENCFTIDDCLRAVHSERLVDPGPRSA